MRKGAQTLKREKKSTFLPLGIDTVEQRGYDILCSYTSEEAG
jgi:hypothetical protein